MVGEEKADFMKQVVAGCITALIQKRLTKTPQKYTQNVLTAGDSE